MAKLCVCQGLPGSGKTTWALREIAAAPPNELVRVNRDLLRLMLHGGNMQHTESKDEYEMEVTIAQRLLIKNRLNAKKSVIVDDTNLHPFTIRKFETMADEFGVDFCLHDEFLAVPLETCLARNAARAEYVPEAVIRDMHERAVRQGMIDV